MPTMRPCIDMMVPANVIVLRFVTVEWKLSPLPQNTKCLAVHSGFCEHPAPLS